WIRHRTASVNEISGRYSVMDDKFWQPSDEELRIQDKINRQGSTDETLQGEDARIVKQNFENDQKLLYNHYTEALDKGMARELARANLPLATYTEWYWKIDLHNLMHFLKLRLDWHAQKEIRVFAQAMAYFVKQRCPLAWEAFEEHILYASKLSKSEWSLVKKTLDDTGNYDKLLKLREEELKAEGASEWKVHEELNALTKAFNKKSLL
ncbi:FAD-dependent thymidylate synthase, partial [bacterium]|nr:FAD-dependent thymidylate synthase [bacterium]